MAAFLGRDDDGATRLAGDGVTLRHPAARYYEAWSHLRTISRDFLQPWEPTWPADDLGRSAFRARLRRYEDDIHADRSYPFFVFREGDDGLVGAATLSRVQRGVAQSATLGYWVGAPFQRRGYTLAAVRALIHFAFGPLHLHRVEAACAPENAASRALLEKAGFLHEGLARSYLKINGDWRDHLLFGLVNPHA